MSASKLGAPNDCIYAFKQQRDAQASESAGKSVEVLSAATVGSDAAAQPEKQNLMVADFQLRRGLLQGNSRKYINQRFL